MFDSKQFVLERNAAFVELVMNDNVEAFKEYCNKYGILISNVDEVVKASVYKAVHEVPGMPDEVKAVAFKKCCDLGFYPFIKEFEGEDENV